MQKLLNGFQQNLGGGEEHFKGWRDVLSTPLRVFTLFWSFICFFHLINSPPLNNYCKISIKGEYSWNVWHFHLKQWSVVKRTRNSYLSKTRKVTDIKYTSDIRCNFLEIRMKSTRKSKLNGKFTQIWMYWPNIVSSSSWSIDFIFLLNQSIKTPKCK